MEKHIAVAEINADSKDDIFEEHPNFFVAPYRAHVCTKSPPVSSSPADLFSESKCHLKFKSNRVFLTFSECSISVAWFSKVYFYSAPQTDFFKRM